MSLFKQSKIKQDLEIQHINHGYRSNTFIRKIDSNSTDLNKEARKVDKTFGYWGWHMATWTYFPYIRDKKSRFNCG